MDTSIQYGIIAIVFAIAVFYIVKRLYPSKNKKGGCAKGCGSCSSYPSEKPEH